MAKGSRGGKNNSGMPNFEPSGLPELKGSEKQIAWAKSIRDKAYEQLKEKYEEYLKTGTREDANAIAKEVKNKLDTGNHRLAGKSQVYIENRDDLGRLGYVAWRSVEKEYKKKKTK